MTTQTCRISLVTKGQGPVRRCPPSRVCYRGRPNYRACPRMGRIGPHEGSPEQIRKIETVGDELRSTALPLLREKKIYRKNP